MTELGKQVWDKMEEMGWENAPEGFHLEYYENIIECTKQELTLNDVGCNLPSKEERVKYCNDVVNKHGVTEIFKRETLIKGFHLGFRYAKSFIK